jgi:3-hydroxyisobutyrate dehydrogenase-like beta-hydroxyacid dehydrogenase
MLLARQEGVDLNVMRDVLLGGAAKSFSLENHGARIISGNFKPGFRTRLMRKDVRLALDIAKASGTVLPTATMAEKPAQRLVRVRPCRLGLELGGAAGAAAQRAARRQRQAPS